MTGLRNIAALRMRILASTVLLAALHSTALAQAGRAVGPRPGWLPRQINLSPQLTPAQRATVIARLEALEALLLRIPELARPDGFEIIPNFQGGSQNIGRGAKIDPSYVREYTLELLLYHPSKAIAGEGCGCLRITVNDDGIMGGETFRNAAGHAVFLEGQRGEKLPLASVVYGTLSQTQKSSTYVLLTSGGEQATRPVSRAEYYEAMIFDAEGKGGEKVAEFRKSLTKTAYEMWLEEAPARKANREQMIASAGRTQTADAVAKFRKALEDNEAAVGAGLKASEASEREVKAKSVGNLLPDKLRAELAAMTPAQRAMPAMVDGTLTGGLNATGWTLVERDGPTVWRALTPNYDFSRARSSPVEVRAIAVTIAAVGTGLQPKVHNALWQASLKMDWSALNRMLALPRQ